MAKREKYDLSSPGTRELRDEIIHGTFVKEGTLLAFPTCFPGMSEPIRADESYITALDATPEGALYGGTSGYATHLFVGMFHGVTGAVLDLGSVAGSTSCAGIGCGGKRFVAGVNGPDGGRLVGRKLQPLPFDLIQEWGFGRTPFDELGKVGDGEAIVHLTVDAQRTCAVGVSSGHVFMVGLDEGGPEQMGAVTGRGHVGLDADGGFLGRDQGDALWRLVPGDRLERKAVSLPPAGKWEDVDLRWARDSQTGRLYTADSEGRLFSYSPGNGWSEPLGNAPMAPVTCMAVTFDGRLFGFCGDGIARFFTLEPGGVRPLGAAASVFERRRYGYEFAAAAVGRDGEIVFGENDALGHLWIYFPRIARPE